MNPVEKNAVYFEMNISKKKHKWQLEKRYSHFAALHKLLKKHFTGLPVLPAKTFFKLKDPAKLDARRQGLENYV